MKILRLIFTFFIVLCIYWNAYAAINLTVSPINYEIDADPWEVVTKTATLFNRSDKTYSITTWKSDFQSVDSTWNPQFVRKSELVYSWQELSTWINIDTNSFIIWPWERKDITFTITIPNDATPWWHYWAVFFKNKNSELSTWNQVMINVDYWVLLLVKVSWEVITKWDVKDITINYDYSWFWPGGWKSNNVIDDCPVVDLTSSNYDWKCYDNIFEELFSWEDTKDLKLDENSNLELSNFDIQFDTLFVNDWNTHIKPNWTIKLVDGEWNQLKWIWKELIKDDAWTITWEKIVDYIPINDNWWNVLPWTERNFESEWKWFPYEWYDENWKKVIKYWTPSEYYTKQNIADSWYLMPRERICERLDTKKINAFINIWYINKDWENVEFTSAKEFTIDYKEKYIWLNPYFFIFWWFIIFFIFFLWLICRKKKKKCINCKKKIDKDMNICPYCWTKQDDKNFKENTKENTNEVVKKSKKKKEEK